LVPIRFSCDHGPFGSSGDGGVSEGADVRFHGGFSFREAALTNRLHWRKRFGARKGANELKIIFESQRCFVTEEFREGFAKLQFIDHPI
jgi:hypothetical protein